MILMVAEMTAQPEVLMAAQTLPHIEEPVDLEQIDVIVEALGVNRRTLDRWSSQKVSEPITRYTRLVANVERTFLSWADVLTYCERNNKGRPLAQAQAYLAQGQSPDPTLSDVAKMSGAPIETVQTIQTLAPESIQTAQTAPVRTIQTAQISGPSTEELLVELRMLRASQEALAKEVSEKATALVASQQESAVLRETVRQLEQRLEGEKQRCLEERQRHQEELKRMDAQIFALQTTTDTRISELQASHEQLVEGLRAELAARRGEASEMRQAAERQQQREAALRWQTATNKRERDFAIAALGELQGASMWKRLTWRPPALELTDSIQGPETSIAVVELSQKEG